MIRIARSLEIHKGDTSECEECGKTISLSELAENIGWCGECMDRHIREDGLFSDEGEGMKTLKQLGISPAPWETADDGMGYKDIWCNAPVTEDSEGENIIAEAISKKDANMMAAAPEMYKHGVELVSALEDWMQKYPPSEFSTFGQAYQLLVESVNNFRAALGKAAGESEVAE